MLQSDHKMLNGTELPTTGFTQQIFVSWYGRLVVFFLTIMIVYGLGPTPSRPRSAADIFCLSPGFSWSRRRPGAPGCDGGFNMSCTKKGLLGPTGFPWSDDVQKSAKSRPAR